MIKRTLYFRESSLFKNKNEQLVIDLQSDSEEKSTPIEDIGLVILDLSRSL